MFAKIFQELYTFFEFVFLKPQLTILLQNKVLRSYLKGTGDWLQSLDRTGKRDANIQIDQNFTMPLQL